MLWGADLEVSGGQELHTSIEMQKGHSVKGRPGVYASVPNALQEPWDSPEVAGVCTKDHTKGDNPKTPLP